MKTKKRRGFIFGYTVLFFIKKSFIIAVNIYRPQQTQKSERNCVCTKHNGKYESFLKKYTGNKFCEFDGVFRIVFWIVMVFCFMWHLKYGYTNY